MRTRYEHPRIVIQPDGQSTHALLVEDGRIVALGSAAQALECDESITLGGACVVPGLCDAHIHMWGLGMSVPGVTNQPIDLREFRQVADVYERLRGAVPSQDWILGAGWDENHWGGDLLSIQILDQMFPDTPVCLRRIDGHAIWVNSAALKRAGLTDLSRFGALVGRDQDGEPNGLLVDAALDPVKAILPTPTEAEDRAVFLQSAQMLRRMGVTAAHHAWTPVARLPMLQALHDSAELPVRLYVMVDGLDPDVSTLRGPYGDALLRVGAMKFFADGAMGSRGARLHDPYREGSRGAFVFEPSELLAKVVTLGSQGWQIATHAIGDEAADVVLDAYAALPSTVRTATRPRLEHAQMLTDAAVQRIGDLGVLASVQFIHMRSDAGWLDEVLSPVQLQRLFRWRDLQSSTMICGGSDFPIEDANPWHAMATAMTRKDARGRVFHVKQSLTFSEAFAAHTTGASWAAFQEHDLGRLTPGYLADFAILDRDPWRLAGAEIWDTEVLGTALNGVLTMK